MRNIMDTSGIDLDFLLNLYIKIDKKMKKNFDESLNNALQTLQTLRKVIVTQRRKWQDITSKSKNKETAIRKHIDDYVMTDEKFVTYIAQLHKDSEVLEHMINHIENDIETAKRNQAETLPPYRPSPDSVSVSAFLPSTNGNGK